MSFIFALAPVASGELWWKYHQAPEQPAPTPTTAAAPRSCWLKCRRLRPCAARSRLCLLMAASSHFEGEIGNVELVVFLEEPKRPLKDGRANPAIRIGTN